MIAHAYAFVVRMTHQIPPVAALEGAACRLRPCRVTFVAYAVVVPRLTAEIGARLTGLPAGHEVDHRDETSQRESSQQPGNVRTSQVATEVGIKFPHTLFILEGAERHC